jgi:hypothetical protein
MLLLEGLHGKHAVRLGIWVPSQHLLWDQGKPRKTLIELAGRKDIPDAYRLLASSAAPNPRALTLVLICAAMFFFRFISFHPSLQVVFLQLLLCAYDLDNHQTVYNTCVRNKRIYEQICLQIYIYLCLRFFDYR